MDYEKLLNLRKKFLEKNFIECCNCQECNGTSINLRALKFKGTDDFFFRVEMLRVSGFLRWHHEPKVLYYKSGAINRPYHAGYSVGLEDILESVPPDIQTNILFHLDLFR